MKYILTIVFILCSTSISKADDSLTTSPESVEITPNIPYTNIPDVSEPKIVIKRNSIGQVEVYETIPYTSIKDLSKPSYTLKEKR
jgi:hypothetical protein